MKKISLPRVDDDHHPKPLREVIAYFISAPFTAPELFYEFVEVNQGCQVAEDYKTQSHGGRRHELEFILWYNDRDMKTQMDLINCMSHIDGDASFWEYTEGWGIRLLPIIRIRMLDGLWRAFDEYITLRLNEAGEEEEVGLLTLDEDNERVFLSFKMTLKEYLDSL